MNNRLKELRLNKGLTLKQVANLIGVSEATVQRYESGKISTLKYEVAEALAALYNVSPGYLMGWESYKSYADANPDWSERDQKWWFNILQKYGEERIQDYLSNDSIDYSHSTDPATGSDAISQVIDIMLDLDDAGQEQLIQYGRFLLSQKEK